jgi:hypothetical protein
LIIKNDNKYDPKIPRSTLKQIQNYRRNLKRSTCANEIVPVVKYLDKYKYEKDKVKHKYEAIEYGSSIKKGNRTKKNYYISNIYANDNAVEFDKFTASH